jgi:NitT/TauT family transport system ATP-binding protein
MDAVALEVTNVSLDYEGMQVLDDITFTAKPGSFTAITGPSGCGKSSLLRVLAGLERPTRGSVTLDSLDITGRPGQVGLVFQDSSLYPWSTVQRNVEFGLRVRKLGRSERMERVSELLELVRLTDCADLYPYQLSGGMAQRVALARALAPRPQVLLLDEPFSALDAQLREAMEAELLRLWTDTNTTMVLVTHSIDEALAVAERLLLLREPPSRIVADVPIDLPHPRSKNDARLRNMRGILLELPRSR